MGLLQRLRTRIRNRRFDDELAEELRGHEEMKRQELEASGMAPDAARAAARRALGNVTLMREESRRIWIAPWLESVGQDARYAVRSLARQPLHTCTAVAVLVLAIGMNTTLFTLFKGAILNPWPAREADRVIRIHPSADGRPVGPSVDEYRFYAAEAEALTAVAWYVTGGSNRLEAPGRALADPASTYISSSFLDVLGAHVQLGSGFAADDDLPGERRAVALVSDFFWRNHFGADPSVVGAHVRISGRPFTIIGVVEPRIDGLSHPVDLWLPLSALASVGPQTASGIDATRSGNCCINVIGRMAPGVPRERARLELQVLHERFTTARGQKPGTMEVFDTSHLAGPSAANMGIVGTVTAAVLLVLVLACANVGNLQLARGLARRRELVTRQAIGASRARIVRQLLVEGLVLSAVAGALSVLAAAVLPTPVMRLLGDEIPPAIAGRFIPDWRVLAFTAAVCTLACLVFALAPAFHATRAAIPLATLDRGGTRRTRLPLRSGLLAVQIATCAVLLVGAALLTRAVAHAMQIDPGFSVSTITRGYVVLPPETPDDVRRNFERQLLAELEGAEGPPVALSQFTPMSDVRQLMAVALPGENAFDHRDVQRRSVSRHFFDVLGIPLVSGRMFASDASGEVVVNEAFVRTYLRGEDPVGRAIGEIDRGRRTVARSHTIVGVVRDAYLTGLHRVDPVVFRPSTTGGFLTRGGPAAVGRIRAAAVGLNPTATIRAWPLTADLRRSLENSRTGAALAGAIGLLGLLLASVGVLGVFAYAVEERRREIGVRRALGARGQQIIGMLVATSGRALISGLGVGLLLSLACGPVLRRYLFGLHPLDPIAYGGVLALLAGTAALATFVPARRACHVDPAITLRDE